MSDLDEFESLPSPPADRRRQPAIWPLVALIALVIAAAAVWWFWLRRPAPEPVPEAAPAEASPAEASPDLAPERDFVVPALEASDPVVRELAGALSAHPRLVAWLTTDDLARRFVVAVSNVAEGTSPRRHLGFLDPREPFREAAAGEAVVIDPRSYARYDALTDVFTSIDAAGFAESFDRLEPILRQAYRELGYPSADFRRTFQRALRRLIRTPRPTGPVALDPGVSSFTFADPALEELSDAQKQLIRMGPENQARIQAKLLEIGRAMGFADADLR